MAGLAIATGLSVVRRSALAPEALRAQLEEQKAAQAGDWLNSK